MRDGAGDGIMEMRAFADGRDGSEDSKGEASVELCNSLLEQSKVGGDDYAWLAKDVVLLSWERTVGHLKSCQTLFRTCGRCLYAFHLVGHVGLAERSREDDGAWL